MAYATTLQFARFLNIAKEIPDLTATGSARARETVGVGDNSNTLFYLDFARVIAGSYELLYGASESAATALTETTHYTLNKDNGTVTLTSAGVTLVATNTIYASYSYLSIELTDTQLQEALDRAESEIDSRTFNHFADGTTVTPDYNQIEDEKHDGRGRRDRAYFLRNYPLVDISTNLRLGVSTGASSIPVNSTNGFPSSGTLGIGTSKVTYLAKSGSAFTGATALTEDYPIGSAVAPYIVEISGTEPGNEPDWEIIDSDSQFDIDFDTGRVVLLESDTPLSEFDFGYPPRYAPNRVRMTYLWGTDSIPDDIVNLTLMIASKNLMHTAVRRATMAGKDSFNPELIDVDNAWIEMTIQKYLNLRSSVI